jgi:trimeric autotransporter adhesin
MATYVNDLRLKEITTGDESGTWGTSTNTNLELIAEAFSYGTEVITTNADTHTTTIADGATDPGRSLYLKYTGTLDSACTITIGPNTVSKVWIIENGTSGSQDIIISQGSGANITIPAGDTKVVYSDGAGAGAAFVDAFASLSVVDLKVQDDLTVTDDASVGGDLTITGASTAATYNGIASKTFGTSSIMIGDTTTGTISGANYNVGLGVDVFAALTGGDGNVAVGFAALTANTTGTDNVAIGRSSMAAATTADQTISIGHIAGAALTTGDYNTFIGGGAGTATTTASNNVAIGNGSFYGNITGASNTAVGTNSLGANTTASNNTAVGYLALSANTTGAENTAVGRSALEENTEGGNNTAVGNYALDANTTAPNNTAVGYAALTSNTIGSSNTAVGDSAMLSSTTAVICTAVGHNAGRSITSGGENTCIGYYAGAYQNEITTGSSNTIIGTYARTSSSIVAAETAIGRYVLGQGTLTATLGYSGNGATINIDGSDTSWAAHSDERLKENITTSTAGLSFVNDLRPVTYTWKAKNAISEDFVNYYDADSTDPVNGVAGKTYHGFVAQEMKATIDAHSEVANGNNLWAERLDDIQQLAPSNLVPMLVKAIQELSAKNDALEARIAALES